MGTAWSGDTCAAAPDAVPEEGPLGEPAAEQETEPAGPPRLVFEVGPRQKWGGSVLPDAALAAINARVTGTPPEWNLLFSSRLHGNSFARMVCPPVSALDCSRVSCAVLAHELDDR